MFSICRLSCFECPAQNFISVQLGNVDKARKKTVIDTLTAMDWAEQIKTEPDASPLKVLGQRVAERKQGSENDFTYLDSAEALLLHTRASVKNACISREPYIAAHPELIGRRVLRCSSSNAVRRLGKEYTFRYLPE